MTKDFSYYKDYHAMFKSPTYDWEHLILSPGCAHADLYLKKPLAAITSKEELKNIRNFIHEYMHYLQNFSTAWGAGVFTDFILSYLKISVSVITGEEKIPLPLKNQKIGNALFDEGITLRKNVIERLDKSDNNDRDLKRDMKKITAYHNAQKIVIDNGTVIYTVGIKAIREHMANLATFLMLGYDDKRIHEENVSYNDFMDDAGRLVNAPEYWIIFEYFYENHATIKNLGKGLFYLMNECLTRLNPDVAFYRFYDFFINHPNRRMLNTYFIDIVNAWIQAPCEITSYNSSFDAVVKQIEEKLKFARKSKGNDLTEALIPILEMIYNNVNVTKGGRELFPPSFDFTDILAWNKHIHDYGTSIIAFPQDIKIMGSPEHCEKYLQPFTLLNAVSLALKEVNEAAEIHCPFLVDIPICNAHYKDPAICEYDAIQMVTIQKGKDSCNLISGIILLGLDKRLRKT